MSWSVLPFGKYRGKTLPQIIVRDLDWFFWMLPKFYGRVADEAQDISRKARAIKIPNQDGRDLQVEYRYDIDGRFRGFTFVEADGARYFRWATRLPYLDLSRISPAV